MKKIFFSEIVKKKKITNFEANLKQTENKYSKV